MCVSPPFVVSSSSIETQSRISTAHSSQDEATPRDPQLRIFVDVILESLDSWLDSEIPKSILVIPVHQIRACGSRDP